MWVEATPHRDQDGEGARQRRRETGSGRESQTTWEDSYKPWSDFGGQRPPPSCHFSCMQWDGERPFLKEDKSPVQYGRKEKRRAQGLDRLEPTWRKKRRIIVPIFQWKKSVYLIIESFRIKRQSRKLPKPVSGTHQLQRKVQARAHSRHTNPHTPTHVDKEAAETRTPEK